MQTNSVIDCAKPTEILDSVLWNSNFIGYFASVIIWCRMLLLKEMQNLINLCLSVEFKGQTSKNCNEFTRIDCLM